MPGIRREEPEGHAAGIFAGRGHVNAEEETRRLIVILVLMHNAFSFWLYPFWGSMSAGLRAAEDVKYMMYTTVICTTFVRLAFAWLFGLRLGLGVKGTAMAMICEWFVHAAVVYARFRSGKRKAFRVI